MTVLTVCGLQRCDGLTSGLQGLGDARWPDNSEAIDEPDSPPQAYSLVIGRGRHTTKKTCTGWLAVPLALTPAGSLIGFSTEPRAVPFAALVGLGLFRPVRTRFRGWKGKVERECERRPRGREKIQYLTLMTRSSKDYF